MGQTLIKQIYQPTTHREKGVGVIRAGAMGRDHELHKSD